LKMLDEFKTLTFKYSTGALSISINDIKTPLHKEAKIKATKEYCATLSTEYNEERIRSWYDMFRDLEQDFLNESGPDNPLIIMLKTGARAKMSQVSQLSVAKGLIANAKGQIIKTPVLHSLKEGLSPFEYFKSVSGARKSMADKKDVTPKAGYLARKLVTAARDLYIAEKDCGTTEGIRLKRCDAVGRFTIDGELIEKNNSEDAVIVRSPITCQSKTKGGICQKCFGINPATRELAEINLPVGVRAAQSLTEPATQLSMRTFHTGGVVELKSSPLTINSSISGKVTVTEKYSTSDSTIYEMAVANETESRSYMLNSKYARLLINSGDIIDANTPLGIYDRNIGQEDISGALVKLEHYYETRTSKFANAIVALESGIVRLESRGSVIRAFINDNLVGETVKEPIYYGTGDYVEAGTLMSHGEVFVTQLYNLAGLKLTGEVFVDRVKNIYNREGIKCNPINIEVIFRAMSEIVILNDNTTGLKRLSHDSDINRILVQGVSQIGKNYPSWLKHIGFGWTKSCLESSSLRTQISLDLPSERIMTGELINKNVTGRIANAQLARITSNSI